jgi:hypothetical protein
MMKSHAAHVAAHLQVFHGPSVARSQGCTKGAGICSDTRRPAAAADDGRENVARHGCRGQNAASTRRRYQKYAGPARAAGGERLRQHFYPLMRDRER